MSRQRKKGDEAAEVSVSHPFPSSVFIRRCKKIKKEKAKEGKGGKGRNTNQKGDE